MPGEIRIANRFESWRNVARRLVLAGVEPQDVVWNDGTSGGSLFEPIALGALQPPGTTFNVPAEFVSQCEYVACHRDPSRWALMHRMLWRMARGELKLLEIASDDDVRAF